MRKAPKMFLLGLLNFTGALLIVASNNLMLLSNGSDAINIFIGPPMWFQSLCLILMIMLSIIVLRVRGGKWIKIPALLLWLVVFLNASHRVTIDLVSDEARETYGLIPVQRMAWGVEDKSFEDSTERHALYWIIRRDDRQMFVFTWGQGELFSPFTFQ